MELNIKEENNINLKENNILPEIIEKNESIEIKEEKNLNDENKKIINKNVDEDKKEEKDSE